jgi:hypothetical protein
MSDYPSRVAHATAPPQRSGVVAGNPGEDTGKTVRPETGAFASPLRTAESFEMYCSQIQNRLAEHAAQRANFLQSAYDRLTRLLHTARAVEDTVLYNELWQHRVAVRELLEALSHLSAAPSAPVPTAPAHSSANDAVYSAVVASAFPTALDTEPPSRLAAPNAGYTALNVPLPGQSDPASSKAGSAAERTPPLPSQPPAAYPTLPLPPKPLSLQKANETNGHIARNAQADDEGAFPKPMQADNPPASGLREAQTNAPAEPAPRPVRQPVRALTDIEADAVKLRASLRGWNDRLPLRSAHSMFNGLNVPNCLRLRAVACRMRRLEEEAGDTEVAEVTELGHDIEDLLDNAGDDEYTVALDYEIEPMPTAYQWGELAERYEETARAEEAFEWWITNRAVLSVTDVQGLAEAVAAIQQRFNRLLFRIGARDPFQQQLFDDLRSWAKEAQCYLYSLRPKVPIAELIEKAQTIDEAWEQAREPLRAIEERQGAVEAVVELVAAPDFGEREAEDEKRLQTALLHCKELRIPFSERRLRDALLPWASFLEDDERFKELLREITLEWERRQEIGKTEPMESEPTSALDELRTELEAVREVTRGKRCLLLGGTCREENRRKIEDALQLSELVWPSTKPSDPLAKFDTELRHADVVALLTRFSRKEWKNAQDICARDGKKFVHLTTGYGVSQVVRHFYQQIAPQGITH